MRNLNLEARGSFSLTINQKKQLERQAKKQGVTFSEYVHNLIFGKNVAKQISTSVTKEGIEAIIDKVTYHHEDSKITICIITLKSGFKTTGVSGVVNADNFDAKVGEKYAYENAFNKIWELEGYKLQCEL